MNCCNLLKCLIPCWSVRPFHCYLCPISQMRWLRAANPIDLFVAPRISLSVGTAKFVSLQCCCSQLNCNAYTRYPRKLEQRIHKSNFLTLSVNDLFVAGTLQTLSRRYPCILYIFHQAPLPTSPADYFLKFIWLFCITSESNSIPYQLIRPFPRACDTNR